MRSKLFDSVLILGAGGQARQVVSVLTLGHKVRRICGFIVGGDSPLVSEINGIPVYSEDGTLEDPSTDITIINGMGRPNRRKAIEKLLLRGFRFGEFIHDLSEVGLLSTIGEGTTVYAGVIIQTNAKIGRFCLLDMNSTVGHDSTIGDYVTIAPGVNISGKVNVGDGTWIGAGSVILESISIGNNCLIGAGSIVTKNIPDSSLCYGAPARVIRKIEDPSSVLESKNQLL